MRLGSVGLRIRTNPNVVRLRIVSRADLVYKIITDIGELLVLLLLHVHLPLQPRRLHLRFTKAGTQLSNLSILDKFFY